MRASRINAALCFPEVSKIPPIHSAYPNIYSHQTPSIVDLNEPIGFDLNLFFLTPQSGDFKLRETRSRKVQDLFRAGFKASLGESDVTGL